MTSTMPTVEAAIVEALRDHDDLDGVQVEPAWPGPDAQREMIFLADDVPAWDLEIPNIKSGRKQRQETYTLTLEVWVFAPSLRPPDAQVAKDRAVELADLIDDILADDPKLNNLDGVQRIVVTSGSRSLVAFEKGWGCQVTRGIEVHARLF